MLGYIRRLRRFSRQPGEGWGLNINNASFKVTKVAPEGAASKSCDPPRVGDLLVGIAGADGCGGLGAEVALTPTLLQTERLEHVPGLSLLGRF